jgi:hypothetical protein
MVNKKSPVSKTARNQKQCGTLNQVKMKTVSEKFFIAWLGFCSQYAYTSPTAVPEDTELVNYRKPGFFSKFAELNQVMWNTNKGLTDSHPYDSRPQVSYNAVNMSDGRLFGE